MAFSGATDHSGPRVSMTEETTNYLRLLVVGAITTSVALEVIAPQLPISAGLAICGAVGLAVVAVARTMRVV